MSYKAIKEEYEQVKHPMIDVDGVLKHRKNSLGQDIHQTDEGIRNFHRWFGNSKTVDKQGRPQVFYHGTGSDIDKFSHDFTGKGNDSYGTGFYFAKSPEMANNYANHTSGGNVIPVYLKSLKPIGHESQDKFTGSQIQKMITSAPNHKESLQNFGDVDYEGYHKVLKGAVDSYVDSPKVDAMNMIHNDFYGGHHREFLQNLTKHTGMDAVDAPNIGNGLMAIFHPHQIKSAIGNNGEFSGSHHINESSHDEGTKYYNFNDWQKDAKKHGLVVRNIGPMAGAIEPVNTYLASHENNAFGGFYHRPKKANSSYFNYGSLTVPKELD